jgi:small subunit ribosomal protein S3
MGQKIHPVGLRLGITRTWDSRWYEKKQYTAWLHEDVAIRKYLGRLTRAAAISKVEIERRANQARVIVHTAKPGIIIGKRGVGIEDIRKSLERMTQKTVQVNVIEIKHPELDARLVAQNIVDQLEKRIAFRRAMKQAIMRTMKAGARGVKVQVSGRLGGSEIARSEQNHDGKVPLHTLRADIDYAHVEAFTTFGRIGTKVWIYKGEVLPEGPRGEPRVERAAAVPAGERAQFRDRRGRRGGRGGQRGPEAPAPGEAAGGTEPTAETAAEFAPQPPPADLAPVAPLAELALAEPPVELAVAEPPVELAVAEPPVELAVPEPVAELALPSPKEILHDRESLESVIEGAPSIEGAHPNEPHSGSVLHGTPPAGMESVADSTPIEVVEHDVAALPETDLGEASE